MTDGLSETIMISNLLIDDEMVGKMINSTDLPIMTE